MKFDMFAYSFTKENITCMIQSDPFDKESAMSSFTNWPTPDPDYYSSQPVTSMESLQSAERHSL